MTKTQLSRVQLATMAACLACAIATPAYATDPTPKWCAGVKIAALPGGFDPESRDFLSDAIYNGYR
jgi:hypothetical protein